MMMWMAVHERDTALSTAKKLLHVIYRTRLELFAMPHAAGRRTSYCTALQQ